ncbi:negative regulator of mitosis [Pseudohyphozyma bogoriensis]|nr:negative regulator of mitosis [Pseudohyphozyma bogoriensis]
MSTIALPAPLHLKAVAGSAISHAAAQQAISSFLTNHAHLVLQGSSSAAAKASLARLAEGLASGTAENEEQATGTSDKKRRKSESAGEGSKRRKL